MRCYTDMIGEVLRPRSSDSVWADQTGTVAQVLPAGTRGIADVVLVLKLSGGACVFAAAGDWEECE